MVIWKLELEPRAVQHIDVPEGARPLTVQVQGDDICLWALVDPGAPVMQQDIGIIGTGHPFGEADPGDYVGTVQQLGGKLVLHVFWRRA